MSQPVTIRKLAHIDDIADGAARGFDPCKAGQPSLFVVRRGACLFAYRDRCPHQDSRLAWRRDATLCRRCGHVIRWPDDGSPDWRCSRCDLSRPEPSWLLDKGRLHGPGCSEPLVASMPGRWLASNAAFAVAAAAALGQPATDAVRAVGEVMDVDGRYRRVDVEGREVRLYLVKNPASWAEAITLASSPDASIVFAMEAFGIRDLVPAWDVDATGVTAARVVATGQRRLDVAAWLEAAGVSAELEPDPVTAIRSFPPGPVFVIANYTAFRDLRQELS